MNRLKEGIVGDQIRSGYIADVTQIIPFDEQEEQDKSYILTWLKNTETLNKPYNMLEHLGVLGILLSPDKKKTYLLHHKKAQSLLPPGGHVDIGLPLAMAVSAELKEELHTKARLLKPSPFFITKTFTRGLNAGHTDITSWFLLEGNPSTNYHIHEKEASKAEWVEISEILQNESLGHLHRAFLKLISIRK